VSAELLLSELYKGDDPMMVHLRLQRASTFGTHSDISFNGPKKRLRLHDLFDRRTTSTGKGVGQV